MCFLKLQHVFPLWRWLLLTIHNSGRTTLRSQRFTNIHTWPGQASFVNKMIERAPNKWTERARDSRLCPFFSFFYFFFIITLKTTTIKIACSSFKFPPTSRRYISSILHLSVWLPLQLVSLLNFPLAALGFSHPASTMKHFALCAIGSSVHGRHPRGHINSAVRTKPPSRQFPSASIPTTETERGQN